MEKVKRINIHIQAIVPVQTAASVLALFRDQDIPIKTWSSFIRTCLSAISEQSPKSFEDQENALTFIANCGLDTRQVRISDKDLRLGPIIETKKKVPIDEDIAAAIEEVNDDEV